ncbi:MAG TPA: hypothetical protein VJU77_07925 [Chthoniobacterales bacterium]|nr:hypothetical protein [Chthoniobacterales bacterium]
MTEVRIAQRFRERAGDDKWKWLVNFSTGQQDRADNVEERLSMEENSKAGLPPAHDSAFSGAEESSAIVCPVCGAKAFHEKCKVICRSEICRGRVIMNCAEF